jgi:hypothetical protein
MIRIADARAIEALLIERSLGVAMGRVTDLHTNAEAQVCHLAAQVLRAHHPLAADRCACVSAAFFARHHISPLAIESILHAGWIISLPRFRESLESGFTP